MESTYQEYLELMKKKYNDTEYKNVNIENLDISSLSYEEIDKYFFHYSWKRYLESYDKNGMKPIIGENSLGLDRRASIFFSKGIEGVLELWDVWLKWRLDRQNNPRYEGNTNKEIVLNDLRFRRGEFTLEEKQKVLEWGKCFLTKSFLNDKEMLKRLYEFQYNEMINSDYLIMDLREKEEFFYDQIDMKKQGEITSARANGREVSKAAKFMYGYYSDFTNPVVDKWNMQTIPGKDMIIEPSRLKRITINGKNDVFSVVSFLYDKYKKEVPLDKQVKFDILDNYMKYIRERKHNNKIEQEQKRFSTFEKKKEQRKMAKQNINVISYVRTSPDNQVHKISTYTQGKAMVRKRVSNPSRGFTNYTSLIFILVIFIILIGLLINYLD